MSRHWSTPEPAAPGRPGTVRRVLVRHCLLPVLRGLTALGAIHMATYWHPDLGTPPLFPADGPDDPRAPYRTSRARFQTWPEG
ncbi:hypothetical protein [Streptomyces tropicalis]|uniref:Uncharacterized protein n=1 Tax=Streptomyces tropicalis TaxID=3034234 RepID=A0ABT6A612_9ACTN|nr:hypothetical protein [Streptomyces tropicalis]MDF3299913.1 hypothetical protein [Streptomyces tropicalis]